MKTLDKEKLGKLLYLFEKFPQMPMKKQAELSGVSYPCVCNYKHDYDRSKKSFENVKRVYVLIPGVPQEFKKEAVDDVDEAVEEILRMKYIEPKKEPPKPVTATRIIFDERKPITEKLPIPEVQKPKATGNPAIDLKADEEPTIILKGVGLDSIINSVSSFLAGMKGEENSKYKVRCTIVKE